MRDIKERISRWIGDRLPEFDLDAPCTSPMNGWWSKHPEPRPLCEREMGHVGKHWCVYDVEGTKETWQMVYVWNVSGGMGSTLSHGWYCCPVCGTPERMGESCSYCSRWLEMVDDATVEGGNLVIVDGTIYRWGKPGENGAFGGSAYTVHMHDGRTLGPDSRLWHKSVIPWEYRARITDNATLEWMGYDMKAAWQQ